MLRAALLAISLSAAPAAFAACLTLASHPEGRTLASVALPPNNPTFALTYVHSVTRTPVFEQYRVDGGDLVETQIRFEQHGPGLPTEADAGGSFTRVDGNFVVTMDRHFPRIVMQVHADQTPRLVENGHATNLARWGNRALVLAAVVGACSGS
ncbi:MAG: DUF1850 domain-containing protein [Betaproteobacteria bacterium]